MAPRNAPGRKARPITSSSDLRGGRRDGRSPLLVERGGRVGGGHPPNARGRRLQTADTVGPRSASGLDDIAAAAEILIASLRARGKLLICGNGGSAADAQHLATEFVSTLTVDNPRPSIPAIALTTDSSLLTGDRERFRHRGRVRPSGRVALSGRRRIDRDLDERQLGQCRARRRARRDRKTCA